MSTVLLIDDSDAVRAQVRAALEESSQFGRILEACDGIAGLRLLLAEPVDIVLCDLEMPGLDGEKLLRARGCGTDAPEVPFLFLTANQDPDRRARLLRSGACDTITKPFQTVDVIARLELQLRVARLQAELREKNAMLERISTHDEVTGLRSRRFTTEALSVEVLRARRNRSSLAVLMCDLDDFKRVNDEHGHAAGDVVLTGVGALIRDTLRGSDVAGRFGGEELLLVLPETDLEGGEVLAERLRAAVECADFAAASGASIEVTMSVGVATLEAGLDSGEALIEAADQALYGAKEAGRNRVVSAHSLPGLDSPQGKRTPDAAPRRSR